jgi:UDP-N-acetyl-D-mannosaminuronate dehydrogenase
MRELSPTFICFAAASASCRVIVRSFRSRSLESALRTSDAIFIATAHSDFVKQLTPALLKKHHIRYVLDGRNILDKAAVEKAGIHYRGIGR